MGSELSAKSEVKFLDFKDILFEFDLSCRVHKGVDFFVRHAKHYGMEAITYIGVRLKTTGEPEPHMDSVILRNSLSPFFQYHKIKNHSEYRFEFFTSNSSRVLLKNGWIIWSLSPESPLIFRTRVR